MKDPPAPRRSQARAGTLPGGRRRLRLRAPAAAPADGEQRRLELVGLDQHVAGLGPLGRADDAAALHEVHEPTGLGETDPQLALEHRRRAELAGDDELHGLDEQLQVAADVLVDLLLLALGGAEDLL